MKNKAALFAGALGGVAPNLFRLGANYASTSPQKIQLIPYFGAMLIFAVLGSLVVWVFQENNLRKPVTNFGSVSAPKDAVKFAVQVGGSTSTSYELPRTSAPVTNADVKINEKPNTGFFQGLGLTRAPQYDISVRVR